MARTSSTISPGAILGFYPPPIAHAFQRATNAEIADVDVLHEDLLGALLAHLAWTCAIASGGAALQKARGAGPLSLGGMLRTIRDACAGSDGAECEPLLGVSADRFPTSPLHAALERAIQLRNSVVHDQRLDLRDAARTAVRSALEAASALRFQVMVVPRAMEELRGELHVYRAASYRGLGVRHPLVIETDAELAPRRVYLSIEGHSRLLPLHPIVVESEGTTGGPLPELHALRDAGKVSMRNVISGRESPPSVRAQVMTALESLAPRSTWIQPRCVRCPPLTIVASRRLGPGDVVGERWRIERYLGSGRTSDVYEASGRDDERVALKLISADIAGEAQALERFRREVAALRRIHHPNVLRHVDDGEDAGSRFVVAELATGWAVEGTLVRDASELLARARSPGAVGLDESTVLALARDVAAGLAELHEHGLVHRDVKLSNVLLTASDGERRALLGDLGIARGFGASSLTYEGLPVGTPEAQAPECGESSEASPTLDVYAFGILLYEALAGAPPFRGTTPQETRAKHRTRLPPLRERAPHVSESLASLIHRCLSKNPAARPKHGADLYARLQRLHDTAPDPARTVDIVRGHRLGHYAVHEPLGEMPGATLFRAIDERTRAAVRVGILDDAVEGDESKRSHALAVLARLQALNCETLVRVREYGEGDGYTWFLVEDAAPCLLEPSREMDVASLLDVLAGAARALEALERASVTHGTLEASVRFFAESTDARARARIELPRMDGTSAGPGDDLRALLELARSALPAAVAVSGHAQRARERASTDLQRLARSGSSSCSAMAAWATRAAEDVRDASWPGRAVRSIRRRRALATFLLVLAATAVLASWWRARWNDSVRAHAAGLDHELGQLVRAGRFCLALRELDDSTAIISDLPIAAGRRTILAIHCAAADGSPPPALIVLTPLARAVELPQRRAALVDLSRDARNVVAWARDRLRSGEPIPGDLEHAFWFTVATAIGESNSQGDPVELSESLLEAAEVHFEAPASPRARNQIDVCIALRLKFLESRAERSPESARLAIAIADRALRRVEKPWNEYTIECYRALCLGALAVSDPSRRESARSELDQLSTSVRRDAAREHATRISDRVYEPGYRSPESLAGIDILGARCASLATDLGRL